MNVGRHPIIIRFIYLVLSVFFAAAVLAEGDKNMTLTLKSPDFDHKGEIPKVFTCDGDDTSPSLSWSGVPENAKSLVLIVDDPDAPDPAKPKMTWVHWVLYNIPPTVAELPRNVGSDKLPAGTREGINDWKKTGYGGPCPPVGRHRYFHKLYALDVELPDLHKPNKTKLEAAMEGHIVGQAELIGTYQH
jgi:Raf kinase inhibitor-like YbhB/YbcL family protein